MFSAGFRRNVTIKHASAALPIISQAWKLHVGGKIKEFVLIMAVIRLYSVNIRAYYA